MAALQGLTALAEAFATYEEAKEAMRRRRQEESLAERQMATQEQSQRLQERRFEEIEKPQLNLQQQELLLRRQIAKSEEDRTRAQTQALELQNKADEALVPDPDNPDGPLITAKQAQSKLLVAQFKASIDQIKANTEALEVQAQQGKLSLDLERLYGGFQKMIEMADGIAGVFQRLATGREAAAQAKRIEAFTAAGGAAAEAGLTRAQTEEAKARIALTKTQAEYNRLINEALRGNLSAVQDYADNVANVTGIGSLGTTPLYKTWVASAAAAAAAGEVRQLLYPGVALSPEESALYTKVLGTPGLEAQTAWEKLMRNMAARLTPRQQALAADVAVDATAVAALDHNSVRTKGTPLSMRQREYVVMNQWLKQGLLPKGWADSEGYLDSSNAKVQMFSDLVHDVQEFLASRNQTEARRRALAHRAEALGFPSRVVGKRTKVLTNEIFALATRLTATLNTVNRLNEGFASLPPSVKTSMFPRPQGMLSRLSPIR